MIKVYTMIGIVILVANVLGYSYKIHRIMGDMLGDHLKMSYPTLHEKIIKDLNGTKISEASVWADKVKRTKKFYWTKKLHYMNLDSCSISLAEIETKCNNECVYSFINDLVERKFEKLSPHENIKFLLHELQDINQPLHVYGRERGGNGFKLIRNKNNRNRTMSLHSLWDNEIPLYYLENYDHGIINTYKISLDEVINFNLALSCGYLYDIKDNFIVFEDYFNSAMVRSLFNNYISLAVNILKKYYD
jgi:hypothetical protein